MKTAVIGSRNFGDYGLLNHKLNIIHNKKPITVIVSGGAKGADKLGEQWADENKIPKTIFYPDWKKYGKKAGFLRNEDIIKNSDVVIAFWDGLSKGTGHSIKLAKKYKKPCLIVNFDYDYRLKRLRRKKLTKILDKIKPKSLF
jgi:SLOG family YspA-like protein